MEKGEKDIQKVFNTILNTPVEHDGYVINCPYCKIQCTSNVSRVGQIDHKVGCIVLVAKDLLSKLPISKPTKTEKPVLLKDKDIDLTDLKKACQDYIDFVDDDEQYHEDNDNVHYIFEDAMETFFGKGVWEFINNRR